MVLAEQYPAKAGFFLFAHFKTSFYVFPYDLFALRRVKQTLLRAVCEALTDSLHSLNLLAFIIGSQIGGRDRPDSLGYYHEGPGPSPLAKIRMPGSVAFL